METTLKQRLIGAVVIIALAVIFVPIILDGSGQQKSVAVNMEAPPVPKFTFKSDLPDPKKLDELPVLEKPNDAPAKQAVVTEHSTPQDPPANTAKPIAKVIDATSNHIRPNAALNTWGVQVAAFSEKAKALVLQEKLLAYNYPAFIEKSTKDAKALYRVKIGPMLNKEDAEKLRDKIKQEHALSGSFLIRHP